MKKTLFIVFTLLIIAGCGKDEKEPSPTDKPTNNGLTADDIFKETGCRPNDIESLNIKGLFVDKSKNKYLYGSKNENGLECFWIAMFNLEGSPIWEVVNKENENSYAYNPQEISNGKIVIANVSYTDIYVPNRTYPVLIDPKNGEPTYIVVKEHYYYSDIDVFDDFFFCSISQNALDRNPKATKWSVQIDNEGNILNQDVELSIPYCYAIWVDYNTFISISPTKVSNNNVFGGQKWSSEVSLPDYLECSPSARIDKDTIIVNYELRIKDDKTETYIYKFFYSTGEVIDNESVFNFLKLETPYTAPDSMTVTLHSIDISNNGQGTTYYTINYTLENKTKDMIILEGTFEAFLTGNKKGEYQTGFFDKIYPGESINRSYTFRSLSDEPYIFIQYKHDWKGDDASILKESLKWKINK